MQPGASTQSYNSIQPGNKPIQLLDQGNDESVVNLDRTVKKANSQMEASQVETKPTAKIQLKPSQKSAISSLKVTQRDSLSNNQQSSSNTVSDQRLPSSTTPIPSQGRVTPNSQQKAKHAFQLIQNPQWLAQASERVEKTIEMINIKKIDEAMHNLSELESVFESSGICVNLIESESTQDTSYQAQPHHQTDNRSGRNKAAIQLAIITKYNLACCYQSKGQSQKCIKYLLSAARNLQSYSNAEQKQSMFKVSSSILSPALQPIFDSSDVQRQKNSMGNKFAKSQPPEQEDEFNEYNVQQASSPNVMDPSADDLKLQNEQFGTQLQANRYLCKFHLQLCAIMSQLGQHSQAFENGQKAAYIAESILIKTNQFCQSSVDAIILKDSKALENQKKLDTESQEDYRASSIIGQQKQLTEKRLIRGSSMTSLYSQEKDRKSVSIRRSRSRTVESGGKPEISQRAASEDPTHKSLERMYTFNLSTLDKQTKLKQKLKEKETRKTTVMKDKVDGSAVKADLDGLKSEPVLTNQAEPKKLDRPASKQSLKHSQSQSSFAQTFQVLERTNIQEKQLLGAQPLLGEFCRLSQEFSKFLSESGVLLEARKPKFASLKEISQVKESKRFKINVRNALGVKDHNNWIYNLNIGNVMNLTPMNSDELNSTYDVFQELSKDTMLEKIILYVVAYFCVGTEIRFQATKVEKKGSPAEYFKVWDSELWHSQSLVTSCLFLPEECPLVDHIIKSYKKHYLGQQSLLSMVVTPKIVQKPKSQINERVMTPKQQLRPKIINNDVSKVSLAVEAENNKDDPNLNPSKSASTNLRKRRTSGAKLTDQEVSIEANFQPKSFIDFQFDQFKLLSKDIASQGLSKHDADMKSIDSQVIINRIPVQFIETADQPKTSNAPDHLIRQQLGSRPDSAKYPNRQMITRDQVRSQKKVDECTPTFNVNTEQESKGVAKSRKLSRNKEGQDQAMSSRPQDGVEIAHISPVVRSRRLQQSQSHSEEQSQQQTYKQLQMVLELAQSYEQKGVEMGNASQLQSIQQFIKKEKVKERKKSAKQSLQRQNDKSQTPSSTPLKCSIEGAEEQKNYKRASHDGSRKKGSMNNEEILTLPGTPKHRPVLQESRKRVASGRKETNMKYIATNVGASQVLQSQAQMHKSAQAWSSQGTGQKVKPQKVIMLQKKDPAKDQLPSKIISLGTVRNISPHMSTQQLFEPNMMMASVRLNPPGYQTEKQSIMLGSQGMQSNQPSKIIKLTSKTSMKKQKGQMLHSVASQAQLIRTSQGALNMQPNTGSILQQVQQWDQYLGTSYRGQTMKKSNSTRHIMDLFEKQQLQDQNNYLGQPGVQYSSLEQKGDGQKGLSTKPPQTSQFL